jgi:predicted phage tail protein
MYPPGPYPPYPPGANYQPTVTVVAPPNGIVSLNWIATPAAQSYRIYQTTPDQPLNFSVVQTVNQLSGSLVTNATVTGLTPGRTYLFQVRAVSPSGQETPAPASAVPTYGQSVLGPPAGLVINSSTGSSVSLSWTAIPGAVSYQVLQSTSSAGPFTPTGSPVTATTATVSGLTPGVTYYFQVVALDPAGHASNPSNTVSTSGSPSLAAPTSVSVGTTTSTSATLTWTGPANASSYRVNVATAAGGPFTQANVSTISSTGATVVGLQPSTPYFFQAIALDSSGAQSPPSGTVQGITTP